MILTISDVLSDDVIEDVRALGATLPFADGAATAGATARAVKVNEQADLGGGAGRVWQARVLQCLRANPVLRAAARPRRFSRLLLSRTRPGGGYGAHVDNAVMRRGDHLLRSDLSFTLFLSEPEAYEGGELEVDLPGMVPSMKGRAGELVLYPSSSIHRVAPVTRGERLVCVGWIQSTLRRDDQRQLLFDLENLRASLRQRSDRNAVEMLTLDKSIANLVRMWAEV